MGNHTITADLAGLAGPYLMTNAELQHTGAGRGSSRLAQHRARKETGDMHETSNLSSYSENRRRQKAALAGEEVAGLIQADNGQWMEPAAFVAAHKADTGASAPAKAAAKPTAPKITAMDVTLAREAAVKAERQRWADVFANDASKGRERGCANLLNCSQNYSSAEILKHLASMPLDCEWTASTPGGKAHADAVWSGAYGQAPAASASEPAANSDLAGDVWSKAWERGR